MKSQRDAVEILEESVNLLRSAPLSTIVVYMTGAIPFTLALLFFLGDMTRNPFASEHLGTWSLGVAALYVWKQVWQGRFAAKLFEMLSPGSARPGSWLRLIAIQGAFQPVGLVLMLPFPWIVAFFRNAALFAALGVSEPASKARRQALLWTGQNWGVLAIMTLAALLLFVNLMVAIVILPQLGRSFLGIEGDFARLGVHIVNLTTIAVAVALTFLAIDPLLDAVYVLRCFYGESLATGEDLRAAFRRAVGLIVLVVAILGIVPRPAMAQALDPVRLDRSIDDVIHRREFTWRSPRPPGAEPQGRWVGWVRKVEEMWANLRDWAKRKIRQWFETKEGNAGDGKDPPAMRRMLEILLGVAVALVTGAAVFFFLRRRGPVVAAEAVTVAGALVNLDDESVAADQMPESFWLKLAEEWLAKGDCRLALRALYLAGLNYLGERGVVSIRRWKSGLDYKRELERRARAKPEMGVVFARNLDLFERGWYGSHAVDQGMVAAFVEGLSEIRDYAERN